MVRPAEPETRMPSTPSGRSASPLPARAPRGVSAGLADSAARASSATISAAERCRSTTEPQVTGESPAVAP